MFETVQGKKIHYMTAGEGKQTVVLIHGWGGTTQSMSALMTMLKQKYRVISLDLPGFGSSENPEKEWGIKEYAELISVFLQQKADIPVIYFGHSFGGALGIYLAATYPHLISHLILAAPSFHRVPKTKISGAAFFETIPVPATVKLCIKKVFYKILFPGSDLFAFPHLEGPYRKIIAEDLTPLLPRINKPTLILWGDLDRDTPPADAILLKKSVKKTKLVIFPGYSHNFPLTHPEKVASELEKFL